MDDRDFDGMNNIADECFKTAQEKGWWDSFEAHPDELAAKLALIHSEVSEALEEVRNGKDPSEVYFTLEVEDQGMKFRQPIPPGDEVRCPPAKPEGFPSELADIIIRVFDLSCALEIDIAAAVRQKMRYNQSRERRHGGKAL